MYVSYECKWGTCLGRSSARALAPTSIVTLLVTLQKTVFILNILNRNPLYVFFTAAQNHSYQICGWQLYCFKGFCVHTSYIDVGLKRLWRSRLLVWRMATREARPALARRVSGHGLSLALSAAPARPPCFCSAEPLVLRRLPPRRATVAAPLPWTRPPTN